MSTENSNNNSMKHRNLFENTFLCGDCYIILKTMEDQSIDLIVTSPPYADQRNYGITNSKIAADNYIEWFKPKAEQIFRV
jgi:site-specific DNA-methyltransferase (cytosine-N4-specific)